MLALFKIRKTSAMMSWILLIYRYDTLFLFSCHDPFKVTCINIVYEQGLFRIFINILNKKYLNCIYSKVIYTGEIIATTELFSENIVGYFIYLHKKRSVSSLFKECLFKHSDTKDNRIILLKKVVFALILLNKFKQSTSLFHKLSSFVKVFKLP